MTQLIHSLWTAPYQESPYRINGGFKNKYYFLLSATLSFFSFKKNVPNSKFKLVTDDIGVSMLIDELGLPYDEVDLKLNNVKLDSDIWSIGKLHAFQQTKPFLHVDFDAFLFKPISKKILEAKIAVCNDEENYKIYNNIIIQFKSGVKIYDTIYRNILKDFNERNFVSSYNMGIFGGNDLTLINEYAERSLKLYKLNSKSLQSVNRAGITCVVEQIYLAYFLKDKKIKPTFFLKNNWIDNVALHISDAHEKGFTHLVSESKRNQEILTMLENRVQREQPKYFEKLQEIKKKSIEIYDLIIK
jgi:heat shock protein HspQ